MGEANANVTLPQGVSLQRLGRVLLDAWEAALTSAGLSNNRLRDS